MPLSLESLEVLDAIERKGSFAAAAHEMGKVPSALTYVVRKLEEDLDVLLFDRRRHRAELTPAGRALLDEGRHLLHAADDLARRVKRLATGWEATLTIVVDDLINFRALLPVVQDFYAENTATRLRFAKEVLGGAWDALVSNRADLVIGGAYDAPSTQGFQIRSLGSMPFVFAVAAHHPLATEDGPLTTIQIARHRIVAVGDTSRNLPARTHGVLAGQDVLVVPTMRDKLEAQIRGLGCGWLPARWRSRISRAACCRRARPSRCALRATSRWPGARAIAARRCNGGPTSSKTRGSRRHCCCSNPTWVAEAGDTRMAVSAGGYRGRFAPSPTGPLHMGSLVTALATWLDARAHGGQWLVRIEDIDYPRCVRGADTDILQTLERLGLAPDEPPVWQSRREALYADALHRLDAAGQLYPCGCSRKEIADSLLHVRERHQTLGYPGTCRHGLNGKLPRAWRVRVPDGPQATICFDDRWQGRQCQDLETEVGDFVLRRADGLWAYQLAVVVDDGLQGITHIVRGDDLLDSTPRQIHLLPGDLSNESRGGIRLDPAGETRTTRTPFRLTSLDKALL